MKRFDFPTRTLMQLQNDPYFDRHSKVVYPEDLARLKDIRTIYQLANETTTTTVTEDIPVIVSRMILETAVAKRVARKYFPTDTSLVGGPGASQRYPNENTVTYGAQTEGSVAITASAIDTGPGVTAVPLLYMGRSDITVMTLEDAQQNWLERAARLHGRDAAVFEDKLALSTFYAGAASAHKEDKTSGDWSVKISGWADNVENDIMETIENILIDKYNPNVIFANTALYRPVSKHPEFQSAAEYGKMGESAHEINPGREGVGGPGVRPHIKGLEVVLTPNQYESTSYANTDSFLVADAEFGANFVDKRPFQIKQHDMPELDLLYLIGSFRTVPTVLQANALSGKTDCLAPA